MEDVPADDRELCHDLGAGQWGATLGSFHYGCGSPTSLCTRMSLTFLKRVAKASSGAMGPSRAEAPSGSLHQNGAGTFGEFGESLKAGDQQLAGGLSFWQSCGTCLLSRCLFSFGVVIMYLYRSSPKQLCCQASAILGSREPRVLRDLLMQQGLLLLGCFETAGRVLLAACIACFTANCAKF